MSSVQWRERQAEEIYRRISRNIAASCPKGLGHWDGAWELVETPSVAFLDAVASWIVNGSDEEALRVQTAAGVLLAAWQEAADAFQATGPQLASTSGIGMTMLDKR